MAEPIEIPFGVWTRVGNFEGGRRYLHGKWLAIRSRINTSSTTESELWRDTGPSAF